jgi:hypothetical protein
LNKQVSERNKRRGNVENGKRGRKISSDMLILETHERK